MGSYKATTKRREKEQWAEGEEHQDETRCLSSPSSSPSIGGFLIIPHSLCDCVDKIMIIKFHRLSSVVLLNNSQIHFFMDASTKEMRKRKIPLIIMKDLNHLTIKQ